MVDENNANRIGNDAVIAKYALDGIINACYSKKLHENYLEEKVNTIQSCINFMKSFCE